MRQVTRWLIAAFAAVGASLIAGSQLSDIGALEGGRLIAAIVAMGVAVLGVAGAIWAATRVLTPDYLTLPSLAKHERESAAGALVQELPELLHDPDVGTIKELETKRLEAIDAERQARAAAARARPAETRLVAAATEAREERKRVDDAAQAFLPYAAFVEYRQVFRQALVGMLFGALIAAAGIAWFAWATHPEAEKDDSTAVTTSVPVAVDVTLTRHGRKVMGTEGGKGCTGYHRRAVAIGGEAPELDLVTLPSPGCKPVRVMLTDELGTAVATEPVETVPECPPRPAFPVPPCIVR